MVKPITGMLRRGLVLDLSVALAIANASFLRASAGLGTATGYAWWYGYHVPAVRHRDAYYTRLEDERAKALGQ
ncbi:cytochrome c oxidase family protein-like protein [Botryosphaeria dothidea]|uniref:Cytochrome c oxidase family protein-like protein n=1 Tax=Botryosphaeria dothidea TaxID=55169 RepID=A0A8H4N565_9PEZI|nr:cytochrome c oxidase family protein-like protein [Botryosphaeria dothidea]